MKKITFLFAILLAMSGVAFGQKAPKLLWERQDTYLENDVPYTPLEVTASGKTIVTVLSGFTGQRMGYRIFDKDGKEIDFAYGRVFSKLKRGKQVSWVFTPDSLLIFNQELSLVKALKHNMPNIISSTEVSDGIIFYAEKAVFKYTFGGTMLWQYISNQNIIGLANSKLTLFRLESGEYLFLDSFGKEKMKVPILGASGSGFGKEPMAVIKSPDAGFWLIGSKEVYKYDSLGVQTGYVDFVKEKIDSYPFFSNKGSIVANNDEEVSTSSIVLVHQKQDGFYLIKINKIGQYQTVSFKDNNLFGAYEPATYQVDEDRVMFQINANSGAKFVGVGNFQEPNKGWVKQIANSDYFVGFNGYVFTLLKEKPRAVASDRITFNEVLAYDLSSNIKWSFKDDTIYYPTISPDFLFINHGQFYSKVRINDGSLVWKKAKPAGSDNDYHFFTSDTEGNDYWIYSTGYGQNTKIDFISKSTYQTSRFFDYPKNYYPLRSGYYIDTKTKTFTTITNGEDNSYNSHILRQYSTRCFYNNATSIEAAGATEVCSGTKVSLSIPKQDATTYQWQKDGKDMPLVNSNTFVAETSGLYSAIVRDEICQSQTETNVIKVTIKPTPEATITTDVKGVVYEPFKVKMTANTGVGLSYQWYKNDSLLANASTFVYEAQKSGNYRVSVSKDGCTKLSEPLKISISIPLSNELVFEDEQVKIYPNPNNGNFSIKLSELLKNADIQLFDTLGRTYPFTNTNQQIHTEGLIRGIYFLRISQNGRSITRKVVVE